MFVVSGAELGQFQLRTRCQNGMDIRAKIRFRVLYDHRRCSSIGEYLYFSIGLYDMEIGFL